MRKRTVIVSREAQAAISRLHPEIKRKVRAAIDAVREEPNTGDLLQQELTGYRKLALGAWRIVYREEGRAIQIYAVGRRGTVYSELAERLVRPVRESGRRYRARPGREARPTGKGRIARRIRARRATVAEPLPR